MTGDVTAPEVVVWVDPTRLPTARNLLELMGASVRPIAFGSPRSRAAGELAEPGVPVFDDLRQMLVDVPAAFVLLATPEGVNPDDLPMAVAQGSRVLALEPVAATPAQVTQAYRIVQPADGSTRPPGRIVHAPAFDRSAGFLAAAGPHDALGDKRAVQVTQAGTRDAGSLFFRLFDAWLTTLDFLDLPERIDAQLSTNDNAPVPDDPRQLTGRLTAHARLPGTGSAAILAADQSTELTRQLTVIGDQAQLIATTGGYRLTRSTGEVMDQLTADREPTYLEQLAAQWRRLIDQRTPPPEHRAERERHALACCHACLLSARTGEPESPRRVLELAGV